MKTICTVIFCILAVAVVPIVSYQAGLKEGKRAAYRHITKMLDAAVSTPDSVKQTNK